MTPESQRIAIAEACGWKNVHEVIVKNVKFQGDDRHCGITSDAGWVPDYLNDLNAMHEAEKVMTPSQCYEYRLWLEKKLGVFAGKGSGSVDEHEWHATAAQRSEAFLKTLGIWKD